MPKNDLNRHECSLSPQLCYNLLSLLIIQIIFMISCVFYWYGTLLKTLLNRPDLSFNSKTTYCFASGIKWKASFRWEVLVWTARCVWMFTLRGRIVSLLRFVVFSWNAIRAPPVSSWLRRWFYGTSLFSPIWETFRSLLFVTITPRGVCRRCGYGCSVSRLLDVTSQSDL